MADTTSSAAIVEVLSMVVSAWITTSSGAIVEVLSEVVPAAAVPEWAGISTASHGHRATGATHRWSGGSTLWNAGHRDRQHCRKY